MPFISIVTPCFNEEENIEKVYQKVKEIFDTLRDYAYEHIFIDNASTDKTLEILKSIANQDKNVKIIVNSRNFGHLRSPFYALFQAKGDAVVLLSADLQEPPSLIPEFIKKWEEGFKVVIAVKKESQESRIIFYLRKLYYNLISKLSEIELIKDFSGSGLYDRVIINIIKNLNDPYPYFRGIISEIGFEKAIVEYVQSKRIKGKTKNNFYTLYDLGMLGLTSYSKVPLRVATLSGFIMSLVSLLIALGYFIYKILFWQRFSLGIAPLIIGLFFFSSIQLFFLGLLGEYIGTIYTKVLNRPLVIEKERINF